MSVISKPKFSFIKFNGTNGEEIKRFANQATAFSSWHAEIVQGSNPDNPWLHLDILDMRNPNDPKVVYHIVIKKDEYLLISDSTFWSVNIECRMFFVITEDQMKTNWVVLDVGDTLEQVIVQA